MVLYKLVNPLIKGKLNTTYDASSSLSAAQKAYESFSKYVSNSTPEFLFTLQKVKSKNSFVGEGNVNDYHHFKLLENKNGLNVSYEIVKFNKVNKNNLKKFKKALRKRVKNNQNGGAYDDIDIDDFEEYDEEDLYRSNTRRYGYDPISLWLYDPYIYPVTRLYIPTFVSTIRPIVTYLYNQY
jgi:hypothetical protein